jgi:hypothetical protein
MAHQIVSDVFKSTEGHGPLFQKACKMLGIPAEFCNASGDLPRKIAGLKDQYAHSENKHILDKVRKLLSLAQSSNEHEASLAMQKVNEFIRKYNIKRIEEHKKSKYIYKVLTHNKKRIENYQRHICSILMDYFFVEIVFTYTYDARNCETYRAFEILGTHENVLMAEYVYFFLLNQLKFLWIVYQKQTRYPASKKRSYWLGVLEGFREKLDRIEKRRQPGARMNATRKTTSALVCAADKKLSRFMQSRFPRLRNIKHNRSRVDAEVYDAGIDAGKRLNLHKGISKKSAYRGDLLSPPK